MTSRMTTSHAALGGVLALALLPALWPGDAAAHTCDQPNTSHLVTARTNDAGHVEAWLSMALAWPAGAMWFTQASIPYQRGDWTRVADDGSDSTDSGLDAPMAIDEVEPPRAGHVRTGTPAGGIPVGSAPIRCDDRMAKEPSRVGPSAATDSGWGLVTAAFSCAFASHQDCLQQ